MRLFDQNIPMYTVVDIHSKMRIVGTAQVPTRRIHDGCLFDSSTRLLPAMFEDMGDDINVVV